MGNVAARCQVDIDGATYWMAIVPVDSSVAEKERYDYDESRVVDVTSMDSDGITLHQESHILS